MQWLLIALAVGLSATSTVVRLGEAPITFRGSSAQKMSSGPLVKVLILGVIVVFLLLAARRYISVVIAGCMICAVAVSFGRRFLSNRKKTARRKAMAQVLSMIMNELASGSTMSEAVEHSARDLSDPDLEEVLLVSARRTKTGGSGALAVQEKIVDFPELKPLATCWFVSEGYGVSQTALLQQAQSGLDAIIAHNQRIAAALQGAQATAGILSILPLFGMMMGFAVGTNVPAFLFGTALGGLLLVGGVFLECCGLLFSQKILAVAQC